MLRGMDFPDPIQLRGTSATSPLLVVRGGERALDDALVRKACELTRTKWGFDGISVFEAPNGSLEELSQTKPGHCFAPTNPNCVRLGIEARRIPRARYCWRPSLDDRARGYRNSHTGPPTSGIQSAVRQPRIRTAAKAIALVPMEEQAYDIWYDPNEVDGTNHAQVLRSWARPGLDITYGKVVLLGDDEQEPIPARIIGFNETSGLITVEILFDKTQNAVA